MHMNNCRSPQFSRRAFTLIELMLSIALVLLLILGINYVFKATADAVGAGEAINTMSRDTQGAAPTIFGDFRNIATNPPCFIISSQIVQQFLNADDAATGSDPTKYVDNGTTYTLNPALYNYRSHRCDMVRFPAHGFYNRHSAGTTSDNSQDLTSATTADDAFITISHAQLPEINNPAVFLPPTNDTTSNTLASQRVGAYAADWVLARTVTLMKDQTSITSVTATDVYYQLAAAGPAAYYNSTSNPTPLPNITPLGYDSLDSNGGATVVQSSRYDLAGITIEQFRRQIQDCLLKWGQTAEFTAGTAGTPSYLWWNPLVYDTFAAQTTPSPVVLEVGNPITAAANITPYPYYALVNTSAGQPAPTYSFGNANNVPNLTRALCNPLIQTPLTSAAIAQMAPYFLQHCSQFIVEYAGDYIQQDNNPGDGSPNYGAMTGIGPDGQIDYVVDANGNKRIRWYGMPRSFYNGPNPTAGTGAPSIRGYDPGNDFNASPTGQKLTIGTQTAVNLQPFVDVIPLRDYWWMYAAAANGSAPGTPQTPPWEVDVNFDPTKDYAAPTSSATYLGNKFAVYNPPTANSARYTCAWYDNMPAMIRILIKVDDPNNKVKDGPWYEYVFKLK
jgi:prepilin-type N-terminal cleavage/methylation domain-containing protein